jgi:hypothetical protein
LAQDFAHEIFDTLARGHLLRLVPGWLICVNSSFADEMLAPVWNVFFVAEIAAPGAVRPS